MVRTSRSSLTSRGFLKKGYIGGSCRAGACGAGAGLRRPVAARSRRRGLGGAGGHGARDRGRLGRGGPVGSGGGRGVCGGGQPAGVAALRLSAAIPPSAPAGPASTGRLRPRREAGRPIRTPACRDRGHTYPRNLFFPACDVALPSRTSVVRLRHPLLLMVLRRTVAKVLSMGLVVRRCA